MCQHHQVYATMCMSISIFTNIFLKAFHLLSPRHSILAHRKVRSLQVALDDRYANKFAPLDRTAIYPKSGQAILYSALDQWNEMP